MPHVTEAGEELENVHVETTATHKCIYTVCIIPFSGYCINKLFYIKLMFCFVVVFAESEK